jgi:hypothetical protein
MGVKAPIASYAVASIGSLDNFDADSVLSTSFTAFLQISKSAVLAALATCSAVGFITLVEHDSILTILIASILR